MRSLERFDVGHQRRMGECAAECKANSSLASPSRVYGDWIWFWTADDLHGETPFDAAELGEGCVHDEDTQSFGLIQIELKAGNTGGKV